MLKIIILLNKERESSPKNKAKKEQKVLEKEIFKLRFNDMKIYNDQKADLITIYWMEKNWRYFGTVLPSVVLEKLQSKNKLKISQYVSRDKYSKKATYIIQKLRNVHLDKLKLLSQLINLERSSDNLCPISHFYWHKKCHSESQKHRHQIIDFINNDENQEEILIICLLKKRHKTKSQKY